MNSLIKTVLSILLLLNTYTLFSQDMFIYKNGDELAVKVLRVTQNDIIYKKASNINGPEYIEDKINLFMIKYENGTKDIFKANKQGGTEGIITDSKENNCKHKTDSVVFMNNKYMIVCKDCNKKIRYATQQEIKSNSSNNSVGNNIPCGEKPIEPPRYNDPQYKQTKKYKQYKKKLKIWSDCTGE